MLYISDQEVKAVVYCTNAISAFTVHRQTLRQF